MAFDPTTAQASFDPSTATPVSGFDASSAKLMTTPVTQPTGPNLAGYLGSVGDEARRVATGMGGALMSADLQGFGGHVAQFAHEALDNATHGGAYQQAQQLNPGQTDDYYKQQVHLAYNNARQSALNKAQDQQQQNQYPGQTVGNFVAGAVGGVDPSYFVPLEGVGAKAIGAIGNQGLRVAAKVGTSATTHAALGAADDATYQAADLATGFKKDFDVQQNLTAAAFSGAVGGAVPVVSDFVKGLFKTRGVDTTPPSQPTGSIKPLTQDRIQLTPEEQAQYHQLLATGDQTDIKQFFEGRQGPQPSWSDVNNWVNHRDATSRLNLNDLRLDFDPYANPDQDTLNQQHRQSVEDHFAETTKDWANAPPIEVVHGPEDIQDPNIRQQALEAEVGPGGTPKGFYATDGLVRAYSGRIGDAETANALLYHEGLAHFGLAQQFGDKLDSVLGTLADRNVGQFGKLVDDWQKANPGSSRSLAAEEVLAEQSEKGPLKPSWQAAVEATIKKFGREKLGLRLSYSDSEITQILALAHDTVINGKNSARSNGFSKTGFNNYQPTSLSTTTPDAQLKFIRARDAAKEPGYQSDDLERIYKSLDANYVKPTISLDEIKRQALDLGISPSHIRDLAETNPGELSVRVYRIGAAANLADAKLSELEGRIETADEKPGDRLAYTKALADFHALNARIKGTPSEIGRALRVAQAFPSYTNGTMQQIADHLKESGSGLASLAEDPLKFSMIFNKIKNLRNTGNVAGAHVVMNAVSKPYWEQYLNTLHMNMMLSALSTHVKAPVDMATGIMRDVIEKTLAILVGATRTALLGGDAGVHPTEVLADMAGLWKAVTDAEIYRQTSEAIKTGVGASVTQTAGGGHSVKPSFQANAYGSVSNPDIPIVSIPSHLIAGQDTFMRSVSMMKQLNGLGARQALNDLGSKASWYDILTLGSSHALNPTADMLAKAHDLTQRTLLLNDNPINQAIGLNKLRGYTPGMTPWERVRSFAANNLAPFIRVESNSLINRVVQRSPLGLLDPYTWKQIRSGGPEADIAIAKMIYGSVLIGMSWYAADKTKNFFGGHPTGNGPDNPDKRKELEAGGWSPRAVEQNGSYTPANNLALSVNPFDQHNATATMVASAREAYEKGASERDVGTGLKLALGSVIHDLAGMSVLSDVTPWAEALNARGATGQEIVNRVVGGQIRSWAPALAGQLDRKFFDPNQHDVVDPNSLGRTAVNEVASQFPGLSQTLPTRESVYGDPLTSGQSLIGIHTPIPGFSGNLRPESTDPTEVELQRLAQTQPKAVVTPVKDSVKLPDGSTKKLSKAEFENYQHVAGSNVVEAVRGLMSDPSWSQLSDDDKVLQIKHVQTQAKKDAREQLFGK